MQQTKKLIIHQIINQIIVKNINKKIKDKLYEEKERVMLVLVMWSNQPLDALI